MPDLELHGPAERGSWGKFQLPFRIVALTLRANTGKRKTIVSALRVTRTIERLTGIGPHNHRLDGDLHGF